LAPKSDPLTEVTHSQANRRPSWVKIVTEEEDTRKTGVYKMLTQLRHSRHTLGRAVQCRHNVDRLAPAMHCTAHRIVHNVHRLQTVEFTD
jgi:hypothetical protein